MRRHARKWLGPVLRWLLRGAMSAMLASVSPVGRAAENAPLGPERLAASADGKTLYVACRDGRELLWVDPEAERVARRVALEAEPTGVALVPNGSRLVVTCAAPKSTVVVLDALSGERLASIPAGHTAMAPAVAPDGRRLYVCNRFDNDVSVIDLEAGTEVARVGAVREPVAAAVLPDGSAVLVANHLALARTDPMFVGNIAPQITRIDARTLQTTQIELPHGSLGVRDLCVARDGRFAYVTHLVCNFTLVPMQLDMGWVNTNVVSVIDLEQNKRINTLALDELYQGTGNPWGVGLTADGATLCVAHAGTHALSVVETAPLRGPLLQMFTSSYVGAIVDDPVKGTRPPRRVKLPGNGPRGLVVAGSNVFMAEYFTDTIAVVDLDSPESAQPRQIALGDAVAAPDPRRRGEMLFNDATICYGHWQSCASCHPDARTDGLNWDLMNDGVGNLKNTKSMILAHRTPPAMAEGVRETAEAAVRSGIEHILFSRRPEEEAAAMDEYLKALRPVPSPRLLDGKLSPAAERGKQLFESERVGCAKCHPAPLYTDRKMHDVGSKGPYEYVDKFDTPTLVECWRTAPYLHDGRYLSVRELIVEGKHGSSRGAVEQLSGEEIDDLVEFVLSL